MLISENFIANEPKPYALPGGFLFLASVPGGTVAVKFQRGGRTLADELRGAIEGFKCRPAEGFDSFEVTSSLSQLVQFYVGPGTVDFSPLSISGGGGGPGQYYPPTEGYSYGAAFTSNTPLAANATELVFNAASNANGATIWHAQASTSNAAGHKVIALLAKATAPASLIDGDGIGCWFNHSGGARPNPGFLAEPVRLPAGKGLYFVNDALVETTTGTLRQVLYTLH